MSKPWRYPSLCPARDRVLELFFFSPETFYFPNKTGNRGEYEVKLCHPKATEAPKLVVPCATSSEPPHTTPPAHELIFPLLPGDPRQIDRKFDIRIFIFHLLPTPRMPCKARHTCPDACGAKARYPSGSEGRHATDRPAWRVTVACLVLVCPARSDNVDVAANPRADAHPPSSTLTPPPRPLRRWLPALQVRKRTSAAAYRAAIPL